MQASSPSSSSSSSSTELCQAAIASLSDEAKSASDVMEKFPKGDLFAMCVRVAGMQQLRKLHQQREKTEVKRGSEPHASSTQFVPQNTIHTLTERAFSNGLTVSAHPIDSGLVRAVHVPLDSNMQRR